MGLIKRIKQLVGKLFLRYKLRNIDRKGRIISLKDAKYIGLIYILNNEETYETISSFVNQLQQKGKKVKAIGFVENKSDTSRFLPKLSYDFIYRKDLNWFGKPKGHYTEDFLEEEFEILINLSNNGNYAVEYLFALSNAKMKITQQHYGQKQHYDLMIQWEKDKSLRNYLNEIIHYLGIIKPSKSK